MPLILCNGMNRSGSTLQYNMARMLVEKTGAGYGESFLPQDEIEGQVSRLESWAAEQKLHVLKTHDLPPSVQHLWEDGSLRLLYIYRDIRDVAASMKRMWNYEGDALLPKLDQAIETYSVMRAMPRGVLWQKYENVMDDHENAVREIAEFLNIPVASELITQIASECSVDKMRKVQVEHQKSVETEQHRRRKLSLLRRVLRNIGIQLNWDVRRKRQFEPVTALHKNHIGEDKGAVGMWKKILSEEEARVITERYRAWLEEENYLSGDVSVH